MTIDKERLRVLAEAATGWSNCDKVWPHAEYDGISVLGAICEEGVQYPVAEIDADTYGGDGDSLKLAQFYAGANPATVLALLSENAAKDKQLAAYATLVKSIEERQRLASNEHAKSIKARDSLQSERDANSILTTENAALAAEVERLRAIVKVTAAVAITMLFDLHPDDVRRTFSTAELEQVVEVTEPLNDKETQVEAVYRSAWDAAMADKGAPT